MTSDSDVISNKPREKDGALGEVKDSSTLLFLCTFSAQRPGKNLRASRGVLMGA